MSMTPDFELDKVRLFNCDCMDFMAEIPDNHYDLAIVDPPYGIKVGIDGKVGIDKCAPCKQYKPVKWDNNIPGEKYFLEVKRVSRNQIIWGVNYFPNLLGGRIVWDKNNSGNFSDCELAYQSFSKGTKMVKVTWNGMIQQDMKNKEKRIHPTQKPIQLYKWLLTNYAKPNDKIFDSHGGSFSSACAALDMGFEFDGCELDKDYFDSAVERIRNHSQLYLDFQEDK